MRPDDPAPQELVPEPLPGRLRATSDDLLASLDALRDLEERKWSSIQQWCE